MHIAYRILHIVMYILCWRRGVQYYWLLEHIWSRSRVAKDSNRVEEVKTADSVRDATDATGAIDAL